MAPPESIIIGIAGGSGSGKTTVARVLLERLGSNEIAYLPHDSYYFDIADLPRDQRARINFDHPDSFDTPLLTEHIKQLRAGQPIEMPVYDFATYTRTDSKQIVQPKRVILVEGILIFSEEPLRKLFDMRIFVDTPDDVRLIRRIRRDVRERGRSYESVLTQWLETVRPMHQEFVEPSRRHAHVIIPEGGLNHVAMEMVVARIEALRDRDE